MKMFQRLRHSRCSKESSAAPAATPWSAGDPQGHARLHTGQSFQPTAVTCGQSPWHPQTRHFKKNVCTEQGGLCRRVNFGAPSRRPWSAPAVPTGALSLCITLTPQPSLSAGDPRPCLTVSCGPQTDGPSPALPFTGGQHPLPSLPLSSCPSENQDPSSCPKPPRNPCAPSISSSFSGHLLTCI